jgi:hypothetical protein
MTNNSRAREMAAPSTTESENGSLGMDQAEGRAEYSMSWTEFPSGSRNDANLA